VTDRTSRTEPVRMREIEHLKGTPHSTSLELRRYGHGDDTLYGNDSRNTDDMAADTLRGWLGTDIYFVNPFDVIGDSDGPGSVFFGQRILSRGYREAGDTEGT